MQRQDDLHILYPSHLKWLMDSHNLKVIEICSILGIPSFQDWYDLVRNPERPIRPGPIASTARIYLKHPDRLPIPIYSMGMVIDRAERLIGDPEKAHQLLEGIFDRQWSTISGWLDSQRHSRPDLASSRLFALLAKMSDDELRKELMDGALHILTQVKGKPVFVYQGEDPAERCYATADDPEARRSCFELLAESPDPGRRRAEEEFVIPTRRAQGMVRSVPPSDSPDDEAAEILREARKTLDSAPWMVQRKTGNTQ